MKRRIPRQCILLPSSLPVSINRRDISSLYGKFYRVEKTLFAAPRAIQVGSSLHQLFYDNDFSTPGGHCKRFGPLAANQRNRSIASRRSTPSVKMMPRLASSARHCRCIGPSSKPVNASSSGPLPAMVSRRMPDQSTAPKHMAQGRQLTTSSKTGCSGPPRSYTCRRLLGQRQGHNLGVGA